MEDPKDQKNMNVNIGLTTEVRDKMIGSPYAETTMHVVTKMPTSASALLASTVSMKRRVISVGIGDRK